MDKNKLITTTTFIKRDKRKRELPHSVLYNCNNKNKKTKKRILKKSLLKFLNLNILKNQKLKKKIQNSNFKSNLKKKKKKRFYFSVDNKFLSSKCSKFEKRINHTNLILKKISKKLLKIPNIEKNKKSFFLNSFKKKKDNKHSICIKREKNKDQKIIKNLKLKKNQEILINIKCTKNDFPIKIKIEPINTIFKLFISFNKEIENFFFLKKTDNHFYKIEIGEYNLKNSIKNLNVKFISLEKRNYNFLFQFLQKDIFGLIDKKDYLKNCVGNENSYFYNFFHKKGIFKRK